MSKKTPIHIISFSHLDLFWGGSREECLSRGSFIIRTALDMLEKYPDYRFMLESTNFLEHHLDCFPEDHERMAGFACEGRLELIPMRSIIYSQLPSGETTVRNLLYGQADCFKNVVKYSPVMSLSDIPGATPQTPQIARLAGMKALVLSRGCPEHTDHICWKALDGSSLPTYYPWHYANCCFRLSNPDYEKMVEQEGNFEKYVSQVDYPQLMHWGMDLYVLDEKIIKNIMHWNADGRRELRFTTIAEFFENKTIPECKTIQGEIPSFWPNIESSWPDIWPLDIPCENMLFKAEYFSSLVQLIGRSNDNEKRPLNQAWRWLLDSMDHNQNGVGGERADDDKLRLKITARDVAQQYAERYARQLASKATSPRAKAFPIVIFNPLAWKRSEPIQARGVIYGENYATNIWFGKPFPYRLIDDDGNEISFKQIDQLAGLANTYEIEFVAKDVPAYGAKTYYLETGEQKKADISFILTRDHEKYHQDANQPIGSDTCENEYFILTVDCLTGALSVFDKKAGCKILEDISLVALEERGGDYICRMPLSGRTFPSIIDSIDWTVNPVFCRVEIKGTIYGQPFTQIITLNADTPQIDIENIINWKKICPVRLEQSFSVPESSDKPEFRYGVPFGQVRFPETIYNEQIPFDKVSLPELGDESDPNIRNIRLINNWVSAVTTTGGVVIGADHRMWEFDGNSLCNCMLRGIGYTSGGQHIEEDGTHRPTVRPPLGEYKFKFRIVPQSSNKIPDGRCGWELNNPLHSVAVGFSTQSDAPGISLPIMPDCTDSNVIVANTKPAEDGNGILFRCFEGLGLNGFLTLPNAPGYKWFETNLLEEDAVPITTTELQFNPFEIKTLLLNYSKSI